VTDLAVERHGPVTVLRIDRAEKHNSIGGSLLGDLVRAFEDAEGDDDVRVVVTTGSGPTFCVGVDLTELAEGLASGAPTYDLLNGTTIGGDKGLPEQSIKQRMVEQLGVGRWAQRVAACTKPSIAALNGPAAGGGLAIAVSHDFRVCSSRGSLKAGFVGVGVAPEMGLTWLLPRLIGWRAARDVLLRNRTIRAAEALELGLVDEVVAPEEVLPRALELASELAAMPATALRLTKRLLTESAGNGWEAQLAAEYRAQALLFGLPETRASLAALAARIGRGTGARGQ
jgi:enoyl-CoA hydratase/carnithine racemase